MQEKLIRKLHDYLQENNPDLLITLQEENRVTDYLRENVASVDGLLNQLLAENKAPSVIEELCMEELTRPLKPSRFNYIKELLEEEFSKDFEILESNGLLITELINMIAECDAVFDELHFSIDNEDDRTLRYAVIGAMYEYLTKS
jgi:hypothetical protein